MIGKLLPGLGADGCLKRQEWMEAPGTRAVIAALQANGARVRFVGGCVRDALLGRPAKDVDLATPDPPGRVSELLAAAGIKVVPTGIAHGTVTAIADGRPIEVTTLRRDVETDGRRAKVAFTDDWVADAARRDFTMNAVFADPDGQVFDPFGGLGDLALRRVRFVGDARTRLEEDVLRLLRFFRFNAWYGIGPPDPDGLAACKAMADRLPGLSAERVQAEVKRLLAAPDPVRIVAIMVAEGIFAPILPEIRHVDRLAALLKVAPGADPILRLAMLLPQGSEAGAVVAAKLKLSNAEAVRLHAAVKPKVSAGVIALTRDLREWRRALQRIGGPVLADLAVIAWADETLLGPVDEDDAKAFGDFVGLARGWTKLRLPVSGRDVEALGVPRGPEIGRLLARLEAWWESGDFRATREACLAQLAAFVGPRAEA